MIRRAPVILALLAASVGAAGATSVARVELPALVAESERAVLGQVKRVSQGLDERGLPSTFVTLEAEDRLYGSDLPPAGQELTLKLYRIAGTPELVAGQRYLLLLRGRSAWGFTGIAGLFQGAFRIEEDARGRRVARSLAGNRSVFGEAGLARWLDVEGLTAEDRARAGRPRVDVPYELLRKAVVGLRATRAARTADNR